MIKLCRKVKEYKGYYANGDVHRIYYRNSYGQFHNIKGPAYIEFYKNVPIIYALGNFIFDQSHTLETRQAMTANFY